MANRANFVDDAMVHAPELFAHAWQLTRSRLDAEDLLQQTWLQAWKGYEGFHEGTNLRAWLYRIMTNAYINFYNKNKKQPITGSLDDVEDFYLYRRVASNGSALASISAEEAVMSMFTDDEVQAALDQLDVPQRQALLLREVEGFSYKEIAEILGVPPGTVGSMLHRSRSLVERHLYEFAVDKGLIVAS